MAIWADRGMDPETRYSDIERLLRISALCLRFVSNRLSSPGDRRSGPLMVRIAQRQIFWREIDALRANGSVDAQSCLGKLSPYFDEVRTLHVRGRLEKSDLPLSEKHPAILLKEHEVTRGLICRCHLRHLHSYVPPGRSGSSSPVPAYSGSNPELQVSGLFQNHR
ncbi:hypothetical protein T06_3165 [Trichinella sp. T6]|nr:hypothetical protein T06_3165 [Trichinella sp. T6]